MKILTNIVLEGSRLSGFGGFTEFAGNVEVGKSVLKKILDDLPDKEVFVFVFRFQVKKPTKKEDGAIK